MRRFLVIALFMLVVGAVLWLLFLLQNDLKHGRFNVQVHTNTLYWRADLGPNTTLTNFAATQLDPIYNDKHDTVVAVRLVDTRHLPVGWAGVLSPIECVVLQLPVGTIFAINECVAPISVTSSDAQLQEQRKKCDWVAAIVGKGPWATHFIGRDGDFLYFEWPARSSIGVLKQELEEAATKLAPGLEPHGK